MLDGDSGNLLNCAYLKDGMWFDSTALRHMKQIYKILFLLLVALLLPSYTPIHNQQQRIPEQNTYRYGHTMDGYGQTSRQYYMNGSGRNGGTPQDNGQGQGSGGGRPQPRRVVVYGGDGQEYDTGNSTQGNPTNGMWENGYEYRWDGTYWWRTSDGGQTWDRWNTYLGLWYHWWTLDGKKPGSGAVTVYQENPTPVGDGLYVMFICAMCYVLYQWYKSRIAAAQSIQ